MGQLDRVVTLSRIFSNKCKFDECEMDFRANITITSAILTCDENVNSCQICQDMKLLLKFSFNFEFYTKPEFDITISKVIEKSKLLKLLRFIV